MIALTTSDSLVSQRQRAATVAVVIPSYRVKDHILSVISRIGPTVSKIYVVDDCCPVQSGQFVQQNCSDPRVTVLFNERNLGVGGATIAGYRQALRDGIDIVVKIDGDGQMDPALIPAFTNPIEQGIADYTKGNRFFSLDNLEGMPALRMFGNAALSFVSKVSSGYWNVMDPTNGYTAIHSAALSSLALRKIDNGYFFESDMLFRLNTIRAVVHEVPMKAFYADEKSSLSILKVLRQFPKRYLSRFMKRLGYNYVLRDFNACSVEILAGSGMLAFGTLFGIYHWYQAAITNTNTPTGTIMLAVLPIIIGVQMLLEAVTLDVLNVPKTPLQTLMVGSNQSLTPIPLNSDEIVERADTQRISRA
jgi:dolichol-phosphate mannosyltransferase